MNAKRVSRQTVVHTSDVPLRERMLRRLRQARARARKLGRPFCLTLDDVERIHAEPCFYCGAAPAGEIDRFDNDLGYTATNCVSACEPCNSSKGRKPVVLFMAMRCFQLKLI